MTLVESVKEAVGLVGSGISGCTYLSATQTHPDWAKELGIRNHGAHVSRGKRKLTMPRSRRPTSHVRRSSTYTIPRLVRPPPYTI